MRLILFFAFTLLSFSVLSQTKELDKANAYFNEFNYEKAIKQYGKIIKSGSNVYFAAQQTAISYSKLGNSQEAVNWYLKVIEFPEFDYNAYFFLSRELQKLKEYDEAQIYLEKYYTRSSDQSNPISDLESFIDGLKTDSARYDINPLAFNSKYDEFGPAFYKDYLVFSSNRPTSGLSRNQDVQTGTSFFKLYKIKELNIDLKKEVESFSKNLQSKYNDGPVCFEADETTMYLTRNSDKTSGNITVLDLFIAIERKGKWSDNVQTMPLRKGNYSVAHAYLDTENRLLYFTSNMPGGFGGMDLYVSRLKDGFLSPPTNLGPGINTVGNELFPFIASDGTLYFTSDGHPGLGGYDLFFSKQIDGQFQKVFNMEYPINTSYDDFSLVLNPAKKFGYFSSNRNGGQGGDDIYGVNINKELQYCLIKGKVTNADNESGIDNVWVDIKNDKNNRKIRVVSNEQGVFSYYLKKDASYTLLSRKKLFQNNINNVTPEMMHDQDELEIIISLSEK